MTSDQCRLYYEITDNPHSRDSVILLHGLGGDLSAWQREQEMLESAGISTIALDLRGHGLSGRPVESKHYSLHRFGLDVSELISELKLLRPVLAGHCFGGMIALYTAATFPHLIRRLVLIDASFKAPVLSEYLAADTYAHAFLTSIAHLFPLSHLKGHRDFRAFVGTKDWDWSRIISDISYTSLRSYFYASDQFQKHNIVNLLKRIDMPALIIQGGDDSIIPTSIAQELHHRLIHSQLHIIPHGNHITVINNPRDIVSLITSFMKS